MKINLSTSIVRLVFEACKRQWNSDSVRNLITLSNGKSMTKSRMTIDGDYPVYGANGFIGKTDKYLVKQPTITVGRVGSCGEINFTTGSAWISDNAMWVSSIRDDIDYSFMYYGLKSLGLSSGAKIAAMPSISQENVYRENLPIPSVQEQRIISQYLDQYLKGVSPENRISLPESIKAIEQTIDVVESLAARITTAQYLREEAKRETTILGFKAFDGILETSEYGHKPLLTLLSEPLQNGLSIPKSGIGEHGILFAKVGIVNRGTMNPRETKRVNIELPTNSSFWMRPGDIFISRGNSLELVGRAAMYSGIPENCAFPDLLIRIRVDKTLLDPQFLIYYFQTVSARKYIESQASGTSPSMKKVSQPKLEKMPIPVPPLDEQRRIVAYLDSVQARLASLRELQSATGEELSALLPSVLDKAFKGEL